MDEFNRRLDSNMDLFQKLSKVRVCTTVRELNEQFPGGPHEGMAPKELDFIEERLLMIKKNIETLGESAMEDLEKDHPDLALRVKNALSKLAAIRLWIEEKPSAKSSTKYENIDRNTRTLRHHQLRIQDIIRQPPWASSGSPDANGPSLRGMAQMSLDRMISYPVDWKEPEAELERQTWAPQGYYDTTGSDLAQNQVISPLPYRATRNLDKPPERPQSPTAKPSSLHRLRRAATNGRNAIALNAMARSLSLLYEGDVGAEMIRDSRIPGYSWNRN